MDGVFWINSASDPTFDGATPIPYEPLHSYHFSARPAPGINDIGLGTGQFPDLGICADCNYAIAVDGDRFRATVVLVHREHDAIHDDARWRVDGMS